MFLRRGVHDEIQNLASDDESTYCRCGCKECDGDQLCPCCGPDDCRFPNRCVINEGKEDEGICDYIGF